MLSSSPPSSHSSPRRQASTLHFLAFALALQLILSLTSSVVSAYSFRTPTAATRWTIGQPGEITIVSTEKAGTSMRYLTITLQQSKGGIFGGSNQIALIQSGVSVLIPANAPPGTTEATQTIQWPVPNSIPSGSNFFVQLERVKEGLFDLGDKASSPEFQIIGVPPPGTNTTTPSSSVNATASPSASSASPTPTALTCTDISEQCVANSTTFIPATATTNCTCGSAVIVPSVVRSSSGSMMTSTMTMTALVLSVASMLLASML